MELKAVKDENRLYYAMSTNMSELPPIIEQPPLYVAVAATVKISVSQFSAGFIIVLLYMIMVRKIKKKSANIQKVFWWIVNIISLLFWEYLFLLNIDYEDYNYGLLIVGNALFAIIYLLVLVNKRKLDKCEEKDKERYSRRMTIFKELIPKVTIILIALCLAMIILEAALLRNSS